MMARQRRPVVGWGDSYEVDATGRIFSLPRVMRANYGSYRRGTREVIPFPVREYLKVTLRHPGETELKQVFVHKIVLEAFVGPRPAGMQCRHLNGNNTDNRLENLAWGTAKENAADKAAHGRQSQGERQPASKLTETDVREIRRKQQSIADQASRYGVSISLIRKVRGREAWKHI